MLYTNSSTERLTITFFLATALHAFAISAVGFSFPKPSQINHSSMEIVLVQKKSEEKPDEANYLAQANQEGGGENAEKIRPATPIITPFPDVQSHIVATPPEPKIAAATEIVEIEELLSYKESDFQIDQQAQIDSPEVPTDLGSDLETTQEMDTIPTSALVMEELQADIASTQAELDDKFEDYAKRPREKFVNASTRESKYANYMDEWRRKVEEVGNENYPNEIRQQALSGRLILTVTLNRDGTIKFVDIEESSGNATLDQAALRIVHLAAPFAAFPQEIREETDILHITRTWKFIYDRLSSR